MRPTRWSAALVLLSCTAVGCAQHLEANPSATEIPSSAVTRLTPTPNTPIESAPVMITNSSVRLKSVNGITYTVIRGFPFGDPVPRFGFGWNPNDDQESLLVGGGDGFGSGVSAKVSVLLCAGRPGVWVDVAEGDVVDYEGWRIQITNVYPDAETTGTLAMFIVVEHPHMDWPDMARA